MFLPTQYYPQDDSQKFFYGCQRMNMLNFIHGAKVKLKVTLCDFKGVEDVFNNGPCDTINLFKTRVA